MLRPPGTYCERQGWPSSEPGWQSSPRQASALPSSSPARSHPISRFQACGNISQQVSSSGKSSGLVSQALMPSFSLSRILSHPDENHVPRAQVRLVYRTTHSPLSLNLPIQIRLNSQLPFWPSSGDTINHVWMGSRAFLSPSLCLCGSLRLSCHDLYFTL